MTMDIGTNNSGNSDLKMTSPKLCEDSAATTISPIQVKKQIKRSFDVAFLMLPDEKIKHKHQNNNNNNSVNNNNNNNNSNSKVQEEDIDVISFDDNENESSFARNFMLKNLQNQIYNQHHLHNHHRIVPRVYDDPTLVLPPSATSTTAAMLINNHSNNSSDIEIQPRSAFTKVPRIESPPILSSSCPPLSASPDQLSCPSNSPPISLSPPRTPQSSGGGGAPTLPNPTIIYNNLRPEYFSGAFQPIPNASKLLKQHHTQLMGFNQRHNQQSNSGNTADLSQNYSNTFHHQNGNGHHPFAPQHDLSGIVRSSPAAAAILSTLIPPALASTFSLTAQNVCAKCNINFRMTSDLVYHMRSHHKNDMAGDLMARRKREEKLKCPVCNESFRERHHLTRHMTAHQDKDGDDTERMSIELNRRHLNAHVSNTLTAGSSSHNHHHNHLHHHHQASHHHRS